MNFRYFAPLLALSLVLVACAEPVATEPVVVIESPTAPLTYPNPVTSTIPAYPYPEPTIETLISSDSTYPAPGTNETGTPVIPPSGYEPQPGDKNLKRDPVFLDLANSRFSPPPATQTFQVEVILRGNLPDPCHSLRVEVIPPDANNVINLDAYSVVKPGEACITVLKPFTANIPLGSYSNGQYSVTVNGERLGEFSAGSGVAPAVPVTP
jgi:hypothetical protein